MGGGEAEGGPAKINFYFFNSEYTVCSIHVLKFTLILPPDIGSKRDPLHFLVIHGSITLSEPPEVSLPAIQTWFSTEQGLVEGIVWHCSDGKLFKVIISFEELPVI